MVFQSPKDIYTVIREYARGGMGVTYLVTSEKTGQPLILKQMHLSRVSDWKMVELFEREAEVLKKLNHPQIPRYIDYFAGSDNKQFCLVQSFIEGETMQAAIEKRTPVDESEFRAYLRQCLQILKYLHHLVPPVIHRDITPKNIILNKGKAFLVDFGSVKNMINPVSTGMSTSVGTFGYMPPEQIMGQSVPASDMYSLGVSFIALATHSDPMQFPLNPKTGQIDANKLLAHVPDAIRLTLEQMTLPGLENRLGNPAQAIRMLDSRETIHNTPAEDTIQTIRELGAPSFLVKLIEKPHRVSMALMILILAVVLLIAYLALTDRTETTATARLPDSETASGKTGINKPVRHEKNKIALKAANNLSLTAIDSILVSKPWTGYNGENKLQLIIRRSGKKLTGAFTAYHKRRNDYSGPSNPANIETNPLGIITLTTNRFADGVKISETYYGNITDDLTGFFGHCEQTFQQGGSVYTVSQGFYFRNDNP